MRHQLKLVLSLFLYLLISLQSFSQKEKEVKVKAEIDKLYGTLLIPEGKKEVPVVLFIAGSGPTDRNGNQGMVQSNTTRLLAEGLAEKGIASLRYDKQGIGKSVKAAKEESDLVFEDMVSDAQLWLDYLLKKKNFSEVIIAGHSQGSLIGILAAKDREVSKIISIAGAGRPIDEILLEQLGAQSEEFLEMAKPIIEKLKKGEEVTDTPPELAALFRKSIQPFLISWMQYDPAAELKKLDKPALILQGSTDIQVPVKDAELLSKASEKADLVLIEGMNHILKDAPEERNANMMTYSNPKLSLSDGVLSAIVDFVLE